MNIGQDKVVSIHYTLTNGSGEVLDSSSGGEPLAYLHGKGNIIPGLEKALEGRKTGEKLDVKVNSLFFFFLLSEVQAYMVASQQTHILIYIMYPS